MTDEEIMTAWLQKLGLISSVNQDQKDTVAAFCSYVRALLSARKPAAPAPSAVVLDDERAARDHELKTDAEVFAEVLDGSKTHEIRFNDRDFKIGDTLRLRETRYTGQEMRGPEPRPLEYTGRELTRVVSHVLEGYGLKPGWVILSFARALLSTSKQAVPEGWAFKVTESDGRTWLTVTTPFGSSATFGCASNNDNGRTIGGQVLTQLKDALAASPAAPAQSAEPVALGEGVVRVDDVMKIFQMMCVSRVMTPNTREGWLSALQIYSAPQPSQSGESVAIGEIEHNQVDGFYFQPYVSWTDLGVGAKLYAAPQPAQTAQSGALTADDVERQYRDGIHIGSGLTRATCPCGFCVKHRFGFNSGDGIAHPATAVVLDDERAAFEAHWCRDVPSMYGAPAIAELRANRDGERYKRDEVQWAWEAWQSRATSPQPDS